MRPLKATPISIPPLEGPIYRDVPTIPNLKAMARRHTLPRAARAFPTNTARALVNRGISHTRAYTFHTNSVPLGRMITRHRCWRVGSPTGQNEACGRLRYFRYEEQHGELSRNAWRGSKLFGRDHPHLQIPGATGGNS